MATWRAAPALAGAACVLAMAGCGGGQHDEIAEFRDRLVDLPGVERVDATSRYANDLILDAAATVRLSSDASETEIADVLRAIPTALEASDLEGLDEVIVVENGRPNTEVLVAADGRAFAEQPDADAVDAASVMRAAGESFDVAPSDSVPGTDDEPIAVEIRYPAGAVWVQAPGGAAPHDVFDLAEPVVRATRPSWSWRIQIRDRTIREPEMTFAVDGDMTIARLDTWRALASTTLLLEHADQERLDVIEGSGAAESVCSVTSQLSVTTDEQGTPSVELDDLLPYLHAQLDIVATMPAGTRYEVTQHDGTPLVSLRVGGQPEPDPLGLGWGPPLQEYLDTRRSPATTDERCDG